MIVSSEINEEVLSKKGIDLTLSVRLKKFIESYQDSNT